MQMHPECSCALPCCPICTCAVCPTLLARLPPQLIQPTHALLSPSLDLHFDDIPGGIAALGAVPGAGWLQIIALVGAHELTIAKQDYTKVPGEIPTFLGFKPDDPEVSRRRLDLKPRGTMLPSLGAVGGVGVLERQATHRELRSRWTMRANRGAHARSRRTSLPCRSWPRSSSRR